ncbi:MAG: trehalase family glycosidase, partial [Planctomycetota bacterium]
VLQAVQGRSYPIQGTYALSNLLQELELARRRGEERAALSARWIFENPIDRISRMIRTRFWDALTRRIDASVDLARIVGDPKTLPGQEKYLYVPAGDPEALSYFRQIARARPELGLRVVALPRRITPGYVRSLDGRHGLLSLALRRGESGKLEGVPYVVPGGRFNEMYGWDSYFEALGLVLDGRLDLAKAMVDNFVYQIRHYGKILNANRSYYLTRSQPPFLTSMILAVLGKLPEGAETDRWLRQSLLAAIREYKEVWTARPRLTETGLSRYHGAGMGPCVEVEPGHYERVFRRYAEQAGRDRASFEQGYRSGELQSPELDRYFVHDRAMRESGHDTTWRFDDRCADFVPVDLNALLYKYEIDIVRILDERFAGELTTADGETQRSAAWRSRAEKRKRRIRELLWDAKLGLFCDHDLKTGKARLYYSPTMLYPLWAADPERPWTRILAPPEARRLVREVLERLEMPGGLAASAADSRGASSGRQWDWPNGWAPHQILAWVGLARHGFDQDAERLIYRWLYAIARNAADYNGTIPEKFDVVRRSHAVFSEYGNVGTKFRYITEEGFGWMNASFQLGLSMLGPERLDLLRRLVPPESVFR